MAKRQNKHSQVKSILFAVLGLTGLGLVITMLLTGTDVALFNPKGLIAQGELNLIILSVIMLLMIGVPTLIILYGFAWHYRESNAKSKYEPHTKNGKMFVFGLWAVPSIFMIVLASVMWPAAHRLDPKKAIASNAKPLTIQVVALRWKWLFIYPEQHIATVNFVEVPVGTPVQFILTADETPMSSFWIPKLGGQLYAMTGHANQLNLMAEKSGDYPGRSAEINGAGFAGMTFTARASSQVGFDQWVNEVHNSSGNLDAGEYANLLKPSQNNSVVNYGHVDDSLYVNILNKYMGSHNHMEHE